MPASTARQQTAVAIAEHAPAKLYGRNKSMASMTTSQKREYASTKGLGKVGPPVTQKRSAKAKSMLGV